MKTNRSSNRMTLLIAAAGLFILLTSSCHRHACPTYSKANTPITHSRSI